MKTITTNEIKKRIERNKSKYEYVIKRVTEEIENEGLQKGRIRPRDPIEREVLNKFKNND
ncbi:hypothetical protein [Globicatella sulfidifaciens]|uniref:Uncharacterized protein n=1 Tax=Globicatella sulfidifaciens TaxID=136093 RepID=A0A7X8H070_9LACT|nr:hypothetical protein [Globicatella sulfidifaciens]NLJ18297.1 hypothetical protein [Globicatella sulfidifaciens]